MKCKHPVAKRVWQGDNMICNECGDTIDTRKPKQEATDLFGEGESTESIVKNLVATCMADKIDSEILSEFTAGEETNEVGGLADHSASVPEVSEGVVTKEVRRLAIPLEPDQLAAYRAEVERLTKLIEGGAIVSEVECRTEYIKRVRRCDTGAIIEETVVDVRDTSITGYTTSEVQKPVQDEAGASVDVEQVQENTVAASEPAAGDDGLVPCPPECGEEGCPYEGGRGPAACGGMQR